VKGIRAFLAMLVCVSIFLPLLCLPLPAQAYTVGGNCGKDAKWMLEDDGTLTIYGSGERKEITS